LAETKPTGRRAVTSRNHTSGIMLEKCGFEFSTDLESETLKVEERAGSSGVWG
jgi:hypothetical protein